MMISTYELTRILNRPGYTVLNGSLPTGTVTTPRQKESSRLWASERDFARAVAAERDIRAVLQPEYRLLHHVANENSHREPGVLAGIPDWDWPIARGGYHGFRLEIKIGRNQPSPMQIAIINLLRAEGHFCVVVWDSLEQVFELCEAYLQGELCYGGLLWECLI